MTINVLEVPDLAKETDFPC